MAFADIESYSPSLRLTFSLEIERNPEERTQKIKLDANSRKMLAQNDVLICVYAIVRQNCLQYVGSTSSGFFARFTNGIQRSNGTGYRWPTTDGAYELLRWDQQGNRTLAEAMEAELAFLHRAIMGEWPIEMNQLSPKRGPVHLMDSVKGKQFAFGAIKWIFSNGLMPHDESNEQLIADLHARTSWRAK